MRRRTIWRCSSLKALPSSLSFSASSMSVELVRRGRPSRTCSLISWMRSWRGSFSAMVRASSRSSWAISSMRAYSSSVYSGKSWKSLVSLAAFSLSSFWASQMTLMNGLAASRPPRDDFLVRLGLAFVVDEVPGVLAGAGFDHGDGDVTVLDDTAGDHDLEHGALTLAPKRGKATHWPSISARRTPETGPSNGRPEIMVGCGGRVQGDDVVGVVRVDGRARSRRPAPRCAGCAGTAGAADGR